MTRGQPVPLVEANERINQLLGRYSLKQATIKANKDTLERLAGENGTLKAELRTTADELNQWKEAKTAMEAAFTKAPSARPVPTKSTAFRQEVQNSDSNRGNAELFEGEVLASVEARSKRKASVDDQNAKRKRMEESVDSSTTLLSSQPFETPVAMSNTPNDYLEEAPTIVNYPGGPCELRCFVCKGNTNGTGDALLEGWRGMLEHLVTEHKTKVQTRRREEESDSEFVYRTCFHRMVNALEIDYLKEGTKTVELIKGQQHLPTRVNSLEPRGELSGSSTRTPSKSTPARNATPGKSKAKTCFICERRVKADEFGYACLHCPQIVCVGCSDVLMSDPEHDGCKLEPDKQSITTWRKLSRE